MKISNEHYTLIKTAIIPLLPKIPGHREHVIAEGKFRDLELRIRWDVLHSVVSSNWICANLYPYMNDDHIDSAMRKIQKELNF